MADFNKLKDTIRGAIYPNGRGAISADKHQAALLDMADTMQETDTKVTELSVECDELSTRLNVGCEGVLINITDKYYTPIQLSAPLKAGMIVESIADATGVYFRNKQGGETYYGADSFPLSLKEDIYEVVPTSNATGNIVVKSYVDSKMVAIDDRIATINSELYQTIKEVNKKGFLIDASIEGWTREDYNLYIDYIYRNDPEYGSGIRVIDAQGANVAYMTFSEYKKGIDKVSQDTEYGKVTLVVNWDYYNDGYNAILENRIAVPNTAFLNTTSDLFAQYDALSAKIAYTDNQDLNRAIKYMSIYKNGARSVVIVYVNRNNGELRLNIDGVIHPVFMRDGNISEYADGLFIIANIDYSLIQQDGDVIYNANVSPFVFDEYRFKTYLDAVTIYPQVPYLSSRAVDDGNGNSFDYGGRACSELIAYRPYYVYNGTPLYQIMCYSEIQYIGYVNAYDSIPTHTKFIKLVWLTSDAISASLMPPSQVNDNSISDAKIISINGNKIEDNTITPTKLSFEIERTNIKVGEKVAPRYNDVVDFPRASVYQDGYMSKEDKQKLDSIDRVEIPELATPTDSGLMSAGDKQKLDSIVLPIPTPVIEGSGMYKNASAYGVLPNNDGNTNADNYQAAVSGGGTIVIDIPGTYEFSKTIKIPSNTTLLFGANVYIKRVAGANGGVVGGYSFINENAYTGIYDNNIKIIGLNLIANGQDAGTTIQGLRAMLGFMHIKNLVVDGFQMRDGADEGKLIQNNYGIQVVDFQNISLTNIYIESYKDGIHLGIGKDFTIRDCRFRTHDDPIALNAMDYVASNAALGTIENGIIDNVHDLDFSGETEPRGRSILIYTGSWSEWKAGESYQYGDSVVSNGKIYRALSPAIGAEAIVAVNQPTHDSESVTTAEGIEWLMYQDFKVGYRADVKNVTISNLFVSQKRSAILSCDASNGIWNRATLSDEMSSIDNIILDKVYDLNGSDYAVAINQDAELFRVSNSYFKNAGIQVNGVANKTYKPTVISLVNNYFELNWGVVLNYSSSRVVKAKTSNTIVYGTLSFNDNVEVLDNR